VETGEHCATLSVGRPGVLHGSRSYLLQDGDGQVLPSHSISAGLDYPGVGPEHSHMKETGRAEYVSVTDDEALVGFQMLSRTEGIIPALESSHAIANLTSLAPTVPSGGVVLLCLSGRGDKDMETAVSALGLGNDLNGGL
jgi:tryptophan synthase beta chain